MTRTLRDTASIAAIGMAAAIAAAAAVAALHAQDALRGWYAFELGAAGPTAYGHVLVTNLRVCVVALLGALLLAQWPRIRPLLDLILVAILALNALLVGAALAAYGTALAVHVLAHVLLELLAVGAAGAAYLDVRRGGRVRPAQLARCSGAVVVVLVIAAALEVHGA